MRPLSPAELLAAAHAHQTRVTELRNRGWKPTQPITRDDLLNYRIHQWLMRQGIQPEET